MADGNKSLRGYSWFIMASKESKEGARIFTSASYTTYFGGVKKLLTEYFTTLVVPQGEL